MTKPPCQCRYGSCCKNCQVGNKDTVHLGDTGLTVSVISAVARALIWGGGGGAFIYSCSGIGYH